MLDLERDLPTTREDVNALRRAVSLSPLDLRGYLEFLAQLPPRSGDPRERLLLRRAPPFELKD